MNSSHAYPIAEHPWESRTLPRRPTLLIAVPPASRRRPPARQPLRWKRVLRAVGRGLRDAAESLAFLALLASLLGGLWAMARIF